MLQTIRNKKLRTFLHISFCFLSVFLCLLLVFNAGIVDCYAIAISTTTVLVGATILAACGITFASYEAAEAGTNALYNNMDSATQSSFDNICTNVGNKIQADSLALKCGVQMTADYWAKILTAVVATFGTYEAINAVVNLSDPAFTGVTLDTPFKYDVACNKSSTSHYIINNMTYTIAGFESGYTLPTYVDLSISNRYTESISIADGVFECYWQQLGGNTINITESILYDVNRLAYGWSLHHFSDTLYFKGTKLVKEVTDTGFALTANGINIVQNGYIMGTSIAVSPGICPDGIWTEKTFSDWLNDLIFGNTLPGNPGIDAVSYPGNDTWHDGSINDDVSIGGNPTIGISVPTTKDGITSLNPDKARDYSNTDVKVDTDVNVDTGTGESTGTSKPNSKPGNTLPALSLPEVLFMEKFPFCLPWDLYCVFSMLSAEPVAPKFDIPIKNERIGLDYTFTIDLSEFETVSKISRLSFSIIFVIALILLSRRIVGA